jgi:hypothetical protein
VFSRTLNSVAGNARLATDDIATEVGRLRDQPGEGVVAIGGPSHLRSTAKSADRRPVGAPWGVMIRRWSPVVLGSGAAGSFWVFVVVVPGKTLVP